MVYSTIRKLANGLFLVLRAVLIVYLLAHATNTHLILNMSLKNLYRHIFVEH